MPKQIIDRDKLLDAAYAIAEGEGLSSLSIRRLAGACGVSAGSIYTYFPSKGELVSAVIERFFLNAFCQDYCRPAHQENFVAFCRRLGASVDKTLKEFRADWLQEIESLSASERALAHGHEGEVMEHMKAGMVQVLQDDPDVSVPLEGALSADAICNLVFDNLVHARHPGNRETLLRLLELSLYRKESK